MNSDIKGIILDVDGVIIGEKIGFNSPDPHKDIIERLRQIRRNGIPISLCTAKPHFSIDGIISDALLDNYHITDGGGVIINPIDKKIVKQYIIDKEKVVEVLKKCLDNNIYTEIYTVDDYFIQESQESFITQKHRHILQKDVVKVLDLIEKSKELDVTKIMPIALDDKEDKKRVDEIFNELNIDLTLSWGIHPVANPLRFGIITAPGISKKEGAMAISQNMNIPLDNILAVGDSTSDWQFISLCGYGAAMGNATDELKKLVLSKDADKCCIGRNVDSNGLLDILNKFNI